MLKRLEKLGGLHVEAGVMQVKEALHRVGPVQTAFARGEECIGVPDGMDNDTGGFEWILDGFQGGIELCDKIKVQGAPRAVH